jgi:subtilisin-like proprotein convertase family protein
MKFPSFSRLFGSDWRARSSRRKARRRPQGGAAARPKAPRLTLEALEDRTVMTVLPAPVVTASQFALPTVATSTADKGTNPIIAQDPVNPQKLVGVFTYTSNLVHPQNPTTVVEGAFSINGGTSWTLFAMPGNQGDPNTNNNGGTFPFSQTTDASVVMDRNENVYIVYSEHDDTNNSGLLILQKFTFTTNAGPTQTGTGAIQDNVLSRYFAGEQHLNPVVAVDNNVPSFSDTAPDGTTKTQTDTMVGKAVYVAFNVFSPTPQSPGEGGGTFNPNTIKVIASADGGATFTSQQFVNQAAASPTGHPDPNYSVLTPAGIAKDHYALPQILFTQASADGRVKGGQLVFAFNDFGANTVVTDTSQPDGGVLARPAATAAVFTRTFDRNTGTIRDALSNSSGTGDPNIPVTTTFTQTLTNIDPGFTTVGDLDVALSSYLPHTNEISITLSAVDAQGRSLGSVTLLNNRTPPSGTNPNIPPPAKGLPDLAGMGGIQIQANPLIWHPAEAVFDQQAARSINDPGLTTSSGTPFIGHFRPEDDSTIFGNPPNLNGGPGGSAGLNGFNGLTRTQLLNSTWTLQFVDNINEGTTPPPQFLDFFKLEFTSNMSTTQFGTDVTVASPFGDKPLPAAAPGAKAAPFATASPASTIGIAPDVVIAQDKSLGAYSQFQGRLYLAYVSLNKNPLGPDNKTPIFPDNTDVTLVASDNSGASWTALSFTDPVTFQTAHGVTVNSDSPFGDKPLPAVIDGFSEGDRPQFNPQLTVDPVTGTIVAAFYDARQDAARARVATYVATSIDGGLTWSPNTFLNTPRVAVDTVAAAKSGLNASSNVVLEPLPANMGQSGDPLGFGTHLGLVANAGHIAALWAGNNNVSNPGDQIFGATATFAAGPRVISGDMGPVVQDFNVFDPQTGAVTTYNNTFASDGTRQLGAFVVTFDRPVDASTFTTGQVQVFYHDTTTPAGGGNVPMTVQSVTPLNATDTFGPNKVGGIDVNRQPTLATQFLVKITDPATGLAPSRVGTYSYSVGPSIRDSIRTGSSSVGNSGSVVPDPTSTDTPLSITTAPTPTTVTSTITVAGVPAAFEVSKVTVGVNITYPDVEDLRLSLIAPDGTRVQLVRENTVFGFDYGVLPAGGANDTTFDDAAPLPITSGTSPRVGSFVPEQPLSGFIGGAVNGPWTLEIVDTFTGTLTTGTLNQWHLHIVFGVPGGSTTPGNFMDMNQNARTGEVATSTGIGDEFVVPTPLAGSGPFQLPYNQNTLPLIIPGPHLATGSAVNPFTGNTDTVTGTFVNGQPVTPDNLVLNGTNNSIDIVFDRNMDPTTISTADILRMIGPTGQVLPATVAVTSLSSSGGIATATTATPHGFTTGELIGIAGAHQQAYNGTFAITVTSPTTFTYQVTGNPTSPATGSISASTFTVAPDPNPGFLRLIGAPGNLGAKYTTAADPDTNHPRTYRITFPTQQYSGTYSLTFASAIRSANGDAIDTNLNAGLDVLRGTNQISPTTIQVTSLTLSGTTATATTATPHGFNTGEQIIIAGAQQQAYNGTFTISVTSPTTFTYQVTGSPTSPATGNIIATRPFTVLRVFDSNDPRTKGNTNPPLPILPGRRAVATITVPDGFPIQNATLSLTINDTSNVSNDALDPHLTATLVGPDGTTVALFTKVGGTQRTGGGGFQNTLFSDTAATPIQQGVTPFSQGPYNPQTPLSALIGKGSSGTYTLFIDNDSTNANIKGTLSDWSLNLSQPTVFTGLGEPVADQFAASFRIFTMLPTNALSHNQWTAVGPASENAAGEGLNGGNSGRIGGLAVDPSDPSGNTVYVGGASGGIWKTTNFLTTSATGPTYVPLTNFGPTNSLNIGQIAVFPRNNDPRQTIIFAITGEGDTGSPGVGILRSMDAGLTWQVLDSTSNTTDPHVGQGAITGISSTLRDHKFVGNNGFQLLVDPNLSPDGQVILYAAMSGPNGGIWISRDTGLHWGALQTDTTPGPEFGLDMVTGQANLAGQATSVALSASLVDTSSHLLQGVFAGIAGQGVFVSTNAGKSFTQTAPVGEPFQGNNLIRQGDFGGSVPVTVSNPSDNPNGAKGRITLVTPFATGNALQDTLLKGWVYAAVVTTGGHLDGLYLSKDFGGNWTKVRLPEFQFQSTGNPPQPAFGVPSNNETLTTDADPLGSTKFAQGNYDVSLAIDPTNPRIVYLGGTEDGQIGVQGGLIRVDTTALFDPKALVAYDDSNNDGGLLQANTTGGVNVNPLKLGKPVGVYEPFGITSQNILNFEVDPNQPFNTQNSTILVTTATNFVNDGTGATWTPFNFDEILQGSTDQHRVVTMKDPVTGHARIIFGDDQGVFTGVDQGNGLLFQSLGGVADPSDPSGTTPIVTGSRNGNLQIIQFYGGASQPSVLAAEIAAAQFYGMAQDDGFPRSDANILSNGNLNWVGPTGDGSSVHTDQTGSGTAYFYKWPCCLNGESGSGTSFQPTDFYQVDIPGVGLISRTGSNANNLVRAGDDPGNGVGEWPFLANGFPGQDVNSDFAVNPVDPNGLVISSTIGRVFRSTNQGRDWFVIGGGAGDVSVDLDGTYAPALAFGAPNTANLNDNIYAGTVGGHVFFTNTGGGFAGGTKWKDITGTGTGALDGSAVQDIVTDPRRGSHDLFAVTLRGVYFMADSTVANPTWQNITGNLFTTADIFNPFGDASLQQHALKFLTSIAVDWRWQIPNDFNNPNGPTHPVLYVAGNGGVYRSVNALAPNNGTQWTVFPAVADGANQNGGMLANAIVTSLSIQTGNVNPANGVTNQPQGPDILMASTYGSGQYAIRLPVEGQILNTGGQLHTPFLVPGQGPRVINAVPSGGSNPTTLTSLTVTFNGPIDPLSIQTTDPVHNVAGVLPSSVAHLVGPGNTPIAITGIRDVTPPPAAGQASLHNVYEIDFAPQTGVGVYVLTLGPNVTDLAGEFMDQNQDGKNGVPGVDTFTANFFLNTRADANNHPKPSVPGIVARVATSSDPNTPVNGLMVLTPTPATATGFRASVWTMQQTDPNVPPLVLPTLAAGDSYVDGVSGDFDGDGKTDYAVRDLKTGDWFVGLNNGSGFSVTKWGNWGSPSFLTWVDVRAGYFFGHNRPEGIAGRAVIRNVDGSIAAENWFIAQSDGTKFTSNFAGTWANEVGFTWQDVLVGDFNGDGFDDVIGRLSAPGNPADNEEFISLSDHVSGWVNKNASFAGQWGIPQPGGLPPLLLPVLDIRVGDFNGDGLSDLVGRFAGYNYVYVMQSGLRPDTTVQFTQRFWQTWASGVTWVDVLVGDFNGAVSASGHRIDDLVARVKENGAVFVSDDFLNNPSRQTAWQVGGWSTAATWVDTQVLDLNGDGLDDLVSRVAQNGAWWVSFVDPTTKNQFQNQTFAAFWTTAATYADTRPLYQL